MHRTGSRCRTVSAHRAADENAREAAREIRREGGGVADDNPFGGGR